MLILHFAWVPYQQLEMHVCDLLVRFGRRAKPNPQLVYLAIDSDSTDVAANAFSADLAASPALQKMAKGWPWPRDVYPLILEKLIDEGHARVVAFDLLFPTPRDGDDAFRAALEKFKNFVVIGSNFVDEQSDSRSAHTTHTVSLPSSSLISTSGVFDENDDRIGFVNFWPDEIDGVVREARYRLRASEIFHTPPVADETVFDSLSARVLQKIGREDRIPFGAKLLRFAPDAEHGGFRPISIYTIFVPSLWQANFQNGEFFRDKIIVIGPFGNFLKDQLPTPFSLMDGPELHLDAINEALGNEFISGESNAAQAMMIFGCALAALALSIFVDRPLLRLQILLVGSAAFLLAGSVFYNIQNRLIFVLSPLLTFNGSGLGSLVWQQVVERAEKARMRRMFERCVSKNVVREMLDNPLSYLSDLGGVRKCAVILVTDIRDFTTITEEADSTKLVAQLNEYFTEMVKCVFSANGTLDKFIGDAILAVWGNIHSEGAERDAERAVTTALRMQHSLALLNADWLARGMPMLRMGIGINYGEVIFGNIGSMEKAEPTVIGDPVNLASRLEGLTKEYGLEIILGESVAELVREKFFLQQVDYVQVKGKSQPIHVHTVLGSRETRLDAATASYLEKYEAALVCYREGDFFEALRLFSDCLNIRENDPLALCYLHRCEDLLRERPAEWSGVFVMSRK